ncbi:MAG: hypothetical protein EOO84_11075 [Pantoea sp.]|uniref:hypothetical protein n=1 Tax=Pantoea sp. TaxID=69393 RepID=UPI0012142440|nr:hypothetical protein [Pantoea sp.]RZK07222.1 MAG: hypothetical protein EOO84_11075 [Pantoea sp.]
MSNTAVMFYKPEFTQSDRKRFAPLIKEYLTVFGLSINDECLVLGSKSKAELFDRVYSQLLANARRSFEHSYIGAYTYLTSRPEITAEQLFSEWISPQNPACRLGEDQYYLQRGELRVVNPFCPYQRKAFIESDSSVHLFLLSKKGNRPWSDIKLHFQGSPVQSGKDGLGIRSYLSQCDWYTPTTNGLHLSASAEDAERESQEVMEFFFNRNAQTI